MSNKRKQIIETATRLFGCYGYHAVGIDWVIAEARVTKTTMYRHFPSKVALIAEVLRQRQREFADSLEEALAKAESPLHGLEKVFEWHQDWFNTQTFTGCMFAHAAAEFPSKGTPIQEIAVEQKGGLTQRIERLLVQLVPADRAKTLAPIMIMLLDGATLSVQVAGQREAAREAWGAARALIAMYSADPRPQAVSPVGFMDYDTP
ncbi:Transcriptional regulator, TetR family [Candidatus Burkholderia pumila]|uniref:Transcriptional regulator, TetR family n=1 Tax=Candidatus Burkholderia pumila TaxID=1090375 RepID=A0ABR5HJX4_9BURK|nr:Transcriptional regulator, TetR family [Candidatus Burkholderia pumila]